MLNAYLLAQWDRCRRKGVWDVDWEPTRVTPLGSVYSALNRVLTLPSDGYSGPQMAREWVMQLASERGVDSELQDPYGVMVHHAHLAEVLARACRQPSDGPLHRFGVLHDKRAGWEYDSTSYEIGGRTKLMRYVMVDHWDDERAMSELHSWPVIGDICVTGLPMVLRVLIVGHVKQGRRSSYWTRASQHPSNRMIRFARKDSKAGREEGFTGTWARVWREDSGVGPDAWIAQMSRDGVLGESVKVINVRVPDKLQRDRVLSDIKLIGRELERQTKAVTLLPMTRSACDQIGRGPCPYQCCCLGMTELTPGESGMFRRREGK